MILMDTVAGGAPGWIWLGLVLALIAVAAAVALVNRLEKKKEVDL